MAKKRRNPIERYGIRLNPTTWTKLEWLAEEQGTNRPALIRRLLDKAVVNVQPPNDSKISVIQVSAAHGEKARKVASRLGISVNRLIAASIDRLESQVQSSDEDTETGKDDQNSQTTL